MTAAERLADLLSAIPTPGRDIAWVADQVVSIAQYSESVVLEYARDRGQPLGLACRNQAAGDEVRLPDFRLGLFRTILARVAVMGSHETGTPFDPYHCSYSLRRSGGGEPVRLDITLINTPSEQRLQITRVLLPQGSGTPTANGSAAAPVSQPSAG